MPQLQLPIFPAGATEINSNIAVQCKDGRVVYFHGHLPVFQHEENSVKSFRYFTSHMIGAGDDPDGRCGTDVGCAVSHREAVLETVPGARNRGVLPA